MKLSKTLAKHCENEYKTIGILNVKKAMLNEMIKKEKRMSRLCLCKSMVILVIFFLVK